jgi:hypothetical protein
MTAAAQSIFRFAMLHHGHGWVTVDYNVLSQRHRHFDCQKKEAAPKGRLPFRKFPSCGLEEDYAAKLEEIPIIEALFYLGVGGEIRQTDVKLLMLPSGKDVHGG